jgi:nucleoside-diphosphate-sugar epimerase
MPEASTWLGGKPLILLTGATGYAGSRLLKPLGQAGYPVRCQRAVRKFSARAWRRLEYPRIIYTDLDRSWFLATFGEPGWFGDLAPVACP